MLLLDLLRLITWDFYVERAVRMLSSLRALRMITLSSSMRSLLAALLMTFKPIGSLLFVGAPPLCNAVHSTAQRRSYKLHGHALHTTAMPIASA